MSPSIEPLPVQKLDTLLAQSLGKDLEIKNLEWRPLTAPGENFGSVIVAITVTLSRSNKTETLHLVVKLPPTNAYLLDLFNSPVSFRKELHFYASMTKELVNLQLECGINEEDLSILVPKFYGGRLGLKATGEFDEQAAIVLENLKYNGYDTEDRIYGMDSKHMEVAIENLAKLHALTIGLKLKKPQIFEKIAKEVLAKHMNETTQNCIFDMLRKAQSDLSDIEEAKPYLDRIKRTIEQEFECKDMVPEEPWATLIHHDFWVNNMMFRHNERGEVVDMKIVDFQLCVYDYGVKDLIFLLVSSSNREILDNKLDDMIDLYYYCFVKVLKSLRVDTEKFSKQKFDEIVRLCGPIKFAQCAGMVQVIQAPRGVTPEMKDMKGKDVFVDVSKSEVYRKKLLTVVTLFDKMGWLLK